MSGLRDGDARALLDLALTAPLDARVRDRIVAETRGNPLALLELPRGLTPARAGGRVRAARAVPLAGRIEESFGRQLDALPAQTRRLLLLAAADPSGDPALVWRAAGRLGIGAGGRRRRRGRAGGVRHAGAVPASAGALGGLPVGAAPGRQALHRALAEATDPAADPDRRAWHRAQAAPGPDEDVAAELERSAGRAQGRGGLAAAAAFLERAAVLTLDPAHRVERALAARVSLRSWPAGPRRSPGPAGGGRGRAARPISQRPRRPDPRPNCVRHRPGQRRPAAAAQGGRAARANRPRSVPHDLSARPAGGGIRRPISSRRRGRWRSRAAMTSPRPSTPPSRTFFSTASPRYFTDGYAAGLPVLGRAVTGARRGNFHRRQRFLWLVGIAASAHLGRRELDAFRAPLKLARSAGAMAELPLALSSGG